MINVGVVVTMKKCTSIRVAAGSRVVRKKHAPKDLNVSLTLESELTHHGLRLQIFPWSKK